MRAITTALLSLTLLGASAWSKPAAAQPATAPELVAAGAKLFSEHCATCHGRRMRNPQWGIDLRTFPRDGQARFTDAVSYGKRAMPPWEDLLSPEQIASLWTYVSSGDPGD